MSKYLVRIKGKQLGPFDGEDLRQLVGIGRLSPTDHVRMEGKEDWIPAEKIKGLDFSKKNNTELAEPSFEVIEEAVLDDAADMKPKAHNGAKKQRMKNLANENPLLNVLSGLFFRQPHKAGTLLVWVLRLQMVGAIYTAIWCLKEDGWKLTPATYTILGIISSYFTACWLASEIVVLLRSCAKNLHDLSDNS